MFLAMVTNEFLVTTSSQETIALYEERLSAADSRRYELENRVASLEAGMQANQTSTSTSTDISSAIQIDNETLREQVLHLQRKISTMEDIIEDAHVMSEKEEVALHDRMKALKEKEDGMKKELSEGRKEVERMAKSETAARNRVEEIDEALRESTVALENARAEVEGLRAELAVSESYASRFYKPLTSKSQNLDGLVASSTAGDLPARVAEFAQRVSSDRARYNDEIAKLQDLLEQYRTRENTLPADGPSVLRDQDIVGSLEVENAMVSQVDI
jgi:CAP-Gly domain-containing linker protein 1